MKTQPSDFVNIAAKALVSTGMLAGCKAFLATQLFPVPSLLVDQHARQVPANFLHGRLLRVEATHGPFRTQLCRVVIALALCGSVLPANAATFITGTPLNVRRSYHT